MVDMNLAENPSLVVIFVDTAKLVFTFITLLSSFSERQLKNVDGRRKSM